MSVAIPENLPLYRRVAWRCAWFIIASTIAVLLRVKITGKENVPQEGAALMLSNHTSVMDFMMPLFGVWRPVFLIGSEQVFKLPIAGWILRLLNGAPVAQGVKDKGAVMHLVNAYKAGHMAAIFPEGKRSWTGRPLPITAGTGRLIHSLQSDVVFCHITTGHLQWPRWAKWPRFVSWHMHYFPVVRYPSDATPEEITADVARRLAIDPDTIPAPPHSYGFRMAEGLPAFLWACPRCFATEALAVMPEDRDSVSCSACGARWRVDVGARIVPHGDEGASMSVAAASDRVRAHFQEALDVERFEQEGVVLEVAGARVSRLQRKEPKRQLLHEGTLRLKREHLEVISPEGGELFKLRYEELLAAILEFQSKLVIRTKAGTLLVEPGEESPHKWHHFLLLRVRALGLKIRA